MSQKSQSEDTGCRLIEAVEGAFQTAQEDRQIFVQQFQETLKTLSALQTQIAKNRKMQEHRVQEQGQVIEYLSSKSSPIVQLMEQSQCPYGR